MPTTILKQLEGVWTGEGTGVYLPNVPEFHYIEELTIKPTAKPVVWEFRSTTIHAVSGKPMHVEVGFIRCPPTGLVELVACHPFGLSECSHGQYTPGEALTLCSSDKSGTISRTPTSSAPFTTEIRRIYDLSHDGKELTFFMDMATNQSPDLRNHLVSKLTKVG